MARSPKTPAASAPPGSMELAHRLRAGVLTDPDFTPAAGAPSVRGPGILEANVEFHLSGPAGSRYTVLVVRAR